MYNKFQTLKADFNNVFVEGNANSVQMARVFVTFALPIMSILMIGLYFVHH